MPRKFDSRVPVFYSEVIDTRIHIYINYLNAATAVGGHELDAEILQMEDFFGPQTEQMRTVGSRAYDVAVNHFGHLGDQFSSETLQDRVRRDAET